MASTGKTPPRVRTGAKRRNESMAKYVKRCVVVCKVATFARHEVAKAYGLKPHEVHDARGINGTSRKAVDTMVRVLLDIGFGIMATTSAIGAHEQSTALQGRIKRLARRYNKDRYTQDEWRENLIYAQVYGKVVAFVERL